MSRKNPVKEMTEDEESSYSAHLNEQINVANAKPVIKLQKLDPSKVQIKVNEVT